MLKKKSCADIPNYTTVYNLILIPLRPPPPPPPPLFCLSVYLSVCLSISLLSLSLSLSLSFSHVYYLASKCGRGKTYLSYGLLAEETNGGRHSRDIIINNLYNFIRQKLSVRKAKKKFFKLKKNTPLPLNNNKNKTQIAKLTSSRIKV